MARLILNCSSAAVPLQKKESQRLRLACPEIENGLGIIMTMKTLFTFRTE